MVATPFGSSGTGLKMQRASIPARARAACDHGEIVTRSADIRASARASRFRTPAGSALTWMCAIVRRPLARSRPTKSRSRVSPVGDHETQ